MLGKILSTAYVAVLSYSLSCGLAYGGEPVKQIAKNNPQVAPANYTSTMKLGEVKVTARPINDSKLKKITQSNNSSIPWGKRASREFELMTPEHMRISGVSVFHVDSKKVYYNSRK